VPHSFFEGGSCNVERENTNGVAWFVFVWEGCPTLGFFEGGSCNVEKAKVTHAAPSASYFEMKHHLLPTIIYTVK